MAVPHKGGAQCKYLPGGRRLRAADRGAVRGAGHLPLFCRISRGGVFNGPHGDDGDAHSSLAQRSIDAEVMALNKDDS